MQKVKQSQEVTLIPKLASVYVLGIAKAGGKGKQGKNGWEKTWKSKHTTGQILNLFSL